MQSEVNARSRGFTLVELLVVIGIIAALAAVVIPNVSRFVGSGEQEANNTERQTVQAAIDLAMASNGVISVNTPAAPIGSTVGDMGFAIITGPPAVALYPEFLRQDPVKCNYEWNASGQLLPGAAGQVCP